MAAAPVAMLLVAGSEPMVLGYAVGLPLAPETTSTMPPRILWVESVSSARRASQGTPHRTPARAFAQPPPLGDSQPQKLYVV